MKKTVTYKIESDEFSKEFNSFTITEGETYFLIGENGIGKSTLMQKLGRGNQFDNHYDITFDAKIEKKDLLSIYKNTNLSKNDIDDVLDDWEDIVVTFKYGEIFKDNNDPLRKINEKIKNKLYLRKKKEFDATYLKQKKIFEDIKEIKELIIKNNVDMKETRFTLEELEKHEYLSYSRCADFFHGAISMINNIINNIQNQISNKTVQYIYANDYHSYIDEIKIKPIIETKLLLVKFKSLVEQYRELSGRVRGLTLKYVNYNGDPSVQNLFWKKNIFFGNTYSFEPSVFDYSFEAEEGYKNFSNGRKNISKCKSIAKKHRNDSSGILFEEPYNFLDRNNIKEMRKIINGIKCSKIITSHSSKSLLPSDIKNIIIFFRDRNGKRAISNFSKIRMFLNKESLSNTNILEQLNDSLITWAMDAENKKLLIVEGFYDVKFLRRYITDPNIEIIPIGGTANIEMAINIMQMKYKNVYYFLDNDLEEEELKVLYFNTKPSQRLMKSHYSGTDYLFFEELITKSKKTESRKWKKEARIKIENGEYDENLKLICNKILMRINKK